MNATTTDNSMQAQKTPRLWGVVAEFRDVDHLLNAARTIRDKGFRKWDCYSPFPVHHLPDAMGQKPTILPWIVLTGGLIGMCTGLFMQWWTNASYVDAVPNFVRGYPYLISGKPFFSLPANIPVIFETTILFAAITAVVGMLALNGLPMLYHPLFSREKFRRATSNGLFIAIDSMDPQFDHQEITELFRSLEAVSVEDVED